MNFVLKLNENEVKRVATFYSDYLAESKNDSVLFFFKSEFVSVTIYKSLKVMFQGSDANEEYKMWVLMLNKELVKTPDKVKKNYDSNDYYQISIGSDEVGTGDFFGPITVCAAYLSKDNLAYVKSLRIDDSKRLTDINILELGEKLSKVITFSLLSLHNEKFNDLTAKGFNMNKIKAYLHNQAMISLYKKIDDKPEVILDEFAHEKLYFSYLTDEVNVFKNITFKQKAESKYASVAIASIIARYAFLKHFDLLSETVGYTLLKGAGINVDILAAKILKEEGENFLYKCAKVNFNTLNKAKAINEEGYKR